ncbi:MAG: glycosyltransferase family 39 protein [Bacteroidales bacterium]|nr:glycosyltransferase family 39 protein [Bacteroidales bacterium]
MEMTKSTSKYYPIYIAIILLLLIPALFINLGLLPLIADEATRALVSLEMELSGNLITPTINGEYYFNKPPLYNWILLSFFQLSGNHSEWIIRLPALISLLLFGLIIYLSIVKYTDKRVAFISALAFITSGRILFYDSMLGLIDLSFSLLIFLNFILIYHFAKKGNYWILFMLSYLVVSVTFLMKGLPAIVFQFITIITALVFFKDWKKLFRIPHFIGIAIFLIIVGGYYLLLWKENPDSNYFQTLLTESTKRTFMEYGWWKTFTHLFTFPPEQFYHLLPWSLLLIFLFKKDFYKKIKENHFLNFLAIVFLVNIPVYWISVESYPRYLFMLYPILLILLINHYYSLKNTDKLMKLFWPGVIILFVISLLVGSWFFFNHDFNTQNKSTLIFYIVLALSLLGMFILWKQSDFRLEILIILLLIIRISFNLVILPERESKSDTCIQKNQAIEISKITANSEVLLHYNTPISVETVYYISSERMDILEKTNNEKEGDYYIFDARDPIREKERIIYSFETRWNNKKLRLSEFE